MAIETTFVLLKPPSVSQGLVGALIGSLEGEGLRIKKFYMAKLSEWEFMAMYHHVKDLPTFPAMKSLYLSEPAVYLLVEGENAIARVRELIGTAVNPALDTLRQRYGNPEVLHDNKIHASDSPEAFEQERILFFS